MLQYSLKKVKTVKYTKANFIPLYAKLIHPGTEEHNLDWREDLNLNH